MAHGHVTIQAKGLGKPSCLIISSKLHTDPKGSRPVSGQLCASHVLVQGLLKESIDTDIASGPVTDSGTKKDLCAAGIRGFGVGA